MMNGLFRWQFSGKSLAWRGFSPYLINRSLKLRPLKQLKLRSFGSKPFDRILIANRGEIAERVIRTCQALDIETVAIYSTADAQHRFVQLADHAVCVGPASASDSYLNTDAVLQAIHDSQAQAVHPGYGFLSENADFAQAVTSAGIKWLGPPVQAVHSMGDKLISKKVAQQAGVDTIPGFPDVVDSMEQALDICQEIQYPILLKAAAGGGGKGMRVCHTDQDVKESWGIAKAEALKFFKDDRLLIEKYIEEPHHIEFQVLCNTSNNNTTEVIVFPERECSIQRRNQKIIEESPSVLLTGETRHAMAQQAARLCQAVGYESAGTLEFLVSKHQEFFFLEMNTRLQVEHPITEAIAKVDLVKGMLWIGAGWGFPPEFEKHKHETVFPHTGHAMEARIYAEDPLRGFLPSTGPLTTYMEPSTAANTPERYVRIDSGVTQGHIVSPHYDPMLSKLIAYAPTRKETILTLQQALDEYVIQGVQHNARLVHSVVSHPAFAQGDTPTNFLPVHYPDGFHGVKLSPEQECRFAVAAAVIADRRRTLLQQPPLVQGRGIGGFESIVVVKLGGLFGTPYFVQLGENTASIRSSMDVDLQQLHTVRLDSRVPLVYEPERCLAHLSLDGLNHTIQVLDETITSELVLQMYGCVHRVLIQSVREHELSLHMKEPEPMDTANLVLSPMPGTLISYAVREGDRVLLGQELCIVEAMKMQNILRSVRSGTVAACRVPVGSSLKADEVILEFEVENGSVAA